MDDIKVGAKCAWDDPAINEYSNDVEMAKKRVFTVISVNGDTEGRCEEPDDIVLISDGITEAEVYAKELVLV